MSFWDIAAGILVAFMVIGAIVYAARNNDRIVFLAGALGLAVIVIWRSSCWYWGLSCDAVTGHENPMPLSAVIDH